MSEQQVEKDFSYVSGERQTATTISKIRKDHLARYEYALQFLQKNAADIKDAEIADVFCGNGYGTGLLAGSLGVKSALGIDGSKDAIEAAKKYFALPNTEFESRYFPFEIRKNAYSAIVCFESIEHVDNPELLLANLVAGLKDGGYLFLSTPNEDAMPFSINKKWFKYHTKHFTVEYISALAEKQGLTLLNRVGQDVYTVKEKRVIAVNDKASMALEPFRAGHQFCIMAFMKKNWLA